MSDAENSNLNVRRVAFTRAVVLSESLLSSDAVGRQRNEV